MLPEGFRWTQRYQYDKGRSALTVDGTQVAFLLDRLDGSWFARLWVHWPIDMPTVTRDCTTYETGKAGIEAWAIRHEARIRDEVARKVWRVG